MSNLIKIERILLKNNKEINENMIQEFIFKDPSVLGLGDLTAIQREKIQPIGGRLDLLLADDNNTRYEIEVQLGATDPSHIIRTIEYWDTEKKRYPQYDHCAVIIAEEITGRFMNVISLFNGAIPLIAIQVSAYKNGNDVSLTFTKIIDRITLGNDEDENYEVTNRAYWESRSTSKMLKNVDEIFKSLDELVNGYELKYNKFYIGLAKDSQPDNFVVFRPRKINLNMEIKLEQSIETDKLIEEAGLDLMDYDNKWGRYRIRISKQDIVKNKELLKGLLELSIGK